MHILSTIEHVRNWRKNLNPSETLAFVPTMGNLHSGHLSLVHEAKSRASTVIVSIFVNPLQFGANEDLEAYPRTFEEDCRLLTEARVSAVFFPTEQELYPYGKQHIYVEPPALQNVLCGASRPGHFRGVTTVVCKLFNIVQPDMACFGCKDYQQLHLIRMMVDELNLPIEIIPVATQRAADGLALSSRNGYLSKEERAQAPQLAQALNVLCEAIQRGNRDYSHLILKAKKNLEVTGWKVDYIEVRDVHTLEPVTPQTKHFVILAAAYLGKTRLIDNLDISL